MNDANIDIAATMLAAAFWRGKLNEHVTDPEALETMVKAAAGSDCHKWRGSARALLNMLSQS